jgi:hypothetical protein
MGKKSAVTVRNRPPFIYQAKAFFKVKVAPRKFYKIDSKPRW